MNRLLPASTLAALLALLAACGSTPPSRYYTLAVPAAAAPADAAPPFAALQVGPVGVPDLIDRSPLVLRSTPNRVEIIEFDLWAQPLKHEIARVLAAHLGARWPRVPVSVAGIAPAPAGAARLIVEVAVFEAGAGQATVDFSWVLQPPGNAAPQRGRVTASEPQGPDSPPGQDAAVAALSRALATAARTLADQLQAAR